MVDKKSFSGRKFMTVTLTITYCLVILGLLATMVLCVSKDNIEAAKFYSGVLLGLFSGFTATFALTGEWYFKRDDRKKGEL